MTEIVRSLSGIVIQTPVDILFPNGKITVHYNSINGNPINNDIHYNFDRIAIKNIIMKHVFNYPVIFYLHNEGNHEITVDTSIPLLLPLGSPVTIELENNGNEDDDEDDEEDDDIHVVRDENIYDVSDTESDNDDVLNQFRKKAKGKKLIVKSNKKSN